jgi:hypothetical protein
MKLKCAAEKAKTKKIFSAQNTQQKSGFKSFDKIFIYCEITRTKILSTLSVESININETVHRDPNLHYFLTVTLNNHA